jgi:hypothetical protein
LVSQNIFKALSTSRDEVWSVLGQVDGRFEQVLRRPAEPANLEGEETAVADMDHGFPAAAGAEPATSTTVNDSVHIKTEPGVDVPMRDA